MKRTKVQPVGRKDPRGNVHLPLPVSGLKHRVPLVPRRRGEPLRLPVPPELGFPVAVQDTPKKAVFQRINSALRGETEAISGCGAPAPSCSPPACCKDCSRPSCPSSPQCESTAGERKEEAGLSSPSGHPGICQRGHLCASFVSQEAQPTWPPLLPVRAPKPSLLASSQLSGRADLSAQTPLPTLPP